MNTRRALPILIVTALASAVLVAITGAPSSSTPVAPHPLHGPAINAHGLSTPPTNDFCQANFAICCYNPTQIEKAYDLAPLYKRGTIGKGTTIVIVDSFGSPTIANDLRVFDQTFGLPDPPSLITRQDGGAVPAWDPTNADMIGWAEETTLDVEWAHAIAPGAKILIEATPVAETEGVTGLPEMMKAENYVINHNLGDVITQSFGATEETFPSKQSILTLRSGFNNAVNHHVTVLAATGDEGATSYMLNGNDFYTTSVIDWPASDPLVTAVGGTKLSLTTTERASCRTWCGMTPTGPAEAGSRQSLAVRCFRRRTRASPATTAAYPTSR